MPSYGRGGAGNIEAVDRENARISADLEASQDAADGVHHDRHDTSEYLRREQQQYAHTGRGGQGNFYSPQELSQTGRFSDEHRSHVLGDGTRDPRDDAQPPSYMTTTGKTNGEGSKVGRGGAGNYSLGVSEAEERAARKRMDEQRKGDELKRLVGERVKEQLAMPQKAKIPGGDPF